MALHSYHQILLLLSSQVRNPVMSLLLLLLLFFAHSLFRLVLLLRRLPLRVSFHGAFWSQLDIILPSVLFFRSVLFEIPEQKNITEGRMSDSVLLYSALWFQYREKGPLLSLSDLSSLSELVSPFVFSDTLVLAFKTDFFCFLTSFIVLHIGLLYVVPETNCGVRYSKGSANSNKLNTNSSENRDNSADSNWHLLFSFCILALSQSCLHLLVIHSLLHCYYFYYYHYYY